MHLRTQHWQLVFLAAAAFNFLIGGPIFFVPKWSYEFAYFAESSANGLRFWQDFGFAVILIGVGYWIVARDFGMNRGIIWLGIFAKLFDVIVLCLGGPMGSPDRSCSCQP